MMGTETEQAPMMATPQKEHEWLQKLVGEWRVQGEANMGPDQPPERFESLETVRSIGGLWTVAEQRGQMPDGSDSVMITTLGYDPGRGRYVGTFIASMMTQLWIYEGTVDASGKVLTLNTEGPDMTGKLIPMQDIMSVEDENHRTLRSVMQTESGEWREIMVAHYERVK